MRARIGLLGFGRIGSYIYERARASNEIGIGFVYDPDRGKTKSIDQSLVVDSEKKAFSMKVDMVVEAADHQAVRNSGPNVLKLNDLLVLSATALADEEVYSRLAKTCEANGTRVYIPHGALLGMDGLYDARETIEEVTVTTTKHPRNIDFSFTTKFKPENIRDETVLYEGTAREACKMFPRNVNAHAVVALSGIGFDRTRSVLVANPHSDDAVQHIIAKGGSTVLEIKRSSAIQGVTGDYTLASVYGSIKRILNRPYGINIM